MKRKNLIKGVNNKHIYIILLVVLIYSGKCFSQCGLLPKDEIRFSLILGDYFANDKISVNFNEVSVFKNLYVTSDGALGLTKGTFHVIDRNGHTYLLVGCKTRRIPSLKRKNLIDLVINDRRFKILLKVSKGKYIVIDKNKTSGYKLQQFYKPPIFD